MGVDTGIRDAVADGLVEGPRLLAAINMLSETSGHADFHLPSGIDLTPFIGGSLVDSVDAARQRARELIQCLMHPNPERPRGQLSAADLSYRY